MSIIEIQKFNRTEVEIHYKNKSNDTHRQVGKITAVGENYVLFHAIEGDERPIHIGNITNIKFLK